MNAIRSALYAIASLLGDLNALARGRYLERVARKYVTRKAGGLIARLFK